MIYKVKGFLRINKGAFFVPNVWGILLTLFIDCTVTVYVGTNNRLSSVVITACFFIYNIS